ncbi:NAD(P)H-dependent oxidoreductase [Kribbella sp. NPDC048915]|uniref:FMN-dependent NADH-azoreductase n=1 Tax=Kribbella sp. NPDC048915 TaxID=3155148 RepID=UPI00340C49A3
MTTLLHLDASARANSHSRRLSAAFAQAWRTARPEDTYVYRDLVADPVPPIGQAWTELCDYALEHEITDPARLPEGARTEAQQAAWAVVEPLLQELVAADVLLIGTPMYNFSVPASLKAWIDQVTFPKARLDLQVVVASARGGSYVPGAPRYAVDHQERYLRDFFDGHFGVTDVTFVNVEWVNATVDPALANRWDDHQASVRDAFTAVDDLAGKIATRRTPS